MEAEEDGLWSPHVKLRPLDPAVFSPPAKSVDEYNLFGSPTSALSKDDKWMGPPDPPVDVSVIADDRRAEVRWRHSTVTVCHPVLAWVVDALPGGPSVTVTGAKVRSAVVSNLVNGRRYTFTVTAVNKAGEGKPSLPSEAVIPWGSVSNIAEGVATGTCSTSDMVLNFANLADEVKRLREQLQLQTGSHSSPVIDLHSPVRSHAVNTEVQLLFPQPNAATNVTASSLAGSKAEVRWHPPTFPSADPVTFWLVDAHPANQVGVGATKVVHGGAARSTIIENLVDQEGLTFVVTACNRHGEGPPSLPSNPVSITSDISNGEYLHQLATKRAMLDGLNGDITKAAISRQNAHTGLAAANLALLEIDRVRLHAGAGADTASPPARTLSSLNKLPFSQPLSPLSPAVMEHSEVERMRIVSETRSLLATEYANDALLRRQVSIRLADDAATRNASLMWQPGEGHHHQSQPRGGSTGSSGMTTTGSSVDASPTPVRPWGTNIAVHSELSGQQAEDFRLLEQSRHLLLVERNKCEAARKRLDNLWKENEDSEQASYRQEQSVMMRRQECELDQLLQQSLLVGHSTQSSPSPLPRQQRHEHHLGIRSSSSDHHHHLPSSSTQQRDIDPDDSSSEASVRMVSQSIRPSHSESHSPKQLQILQSFGLELDARRLAKGFAPIHVAAWKGHAEALTTLLTAGAEVDAITIGGLTALHWAACHGNVPSVRALLTAGASVNAVGDDGGSALHLASFLGNVDAARVLLEYGASIAMRNGDNETPLDIAKRKGHAVVLHLLRSVAKERARTVRRSEYLDPELTTIV